MTDGEFITIGEPIHTAAGHGVTGVVAMYEDGLQRGILLTFRCTCHDGEEFTFAIPDEGVQALVDDIVAELNDEEK